MPWLQWIQRVFGCLIINWIAQNSAHTNAHPNPSPPPQKKKKIEKIKTGLCNKY